MNKLSLSILLVEDHLAIARQVLDFLDGLGWQTDHAGTGALAVQLATRNNYDVVLLDLNLPDIDGLQVCRAIKAGAPSNVPILMLTARDAYEDKARGFRDGADRAVYLVGHGSMQRDDFELAADDFASWLAADCPLA